MAVLSLQQALQDAANAGFTGAALTTVIAIALAESSLDTQAVNVAGNTPPSRDRGIMQINSYWHPEVSDTCAFDPICAFQEAYRISASGADFTPWSTYVNGAYKSHLAAVQAAQQSSGGTQPVASVHWQQPGFMAMPETDGHGDTCGPIAIADYLAVAQGLALNTATIDAMRQSLINLGLMNLPSEVGMTLSQINTALVTHYGVRPVKFVDFTYTLDLNQFHADLIAASLAHQAVIIEPGKAFNLPNNQSGVNYHFIIAWGIDSALGYWVANGDTYAALTSHVPVSPVWYDIGQIEGAYPCGYIVLPAVSAPVAPPPSGGGITVPGVPAGWTDDGTILKPNGSQYGYTQGFRDYVLAHTWSSLDTPLEDAQSFLEHANPAMGSGTSQVSRFTTLGWQKSTNNVYVVAIGQEVMWYRQQIANLEAELAAAKATPPPAPPPPAPKPSYAQQIAAVQDAVTALDNDLKANGEA